MKLGIIRCMQTEDYCPGTTDFKMIREHKGAFEGIDEEIELIPGIPGLWKQHLPCCPLTEPEETTNLLWWSMMLWMDVFETYRQVMGTAKNARTRNQVIKWLKNPHTDSAEYKMWGNGVALPCVSFVLAGIAYYADK